MKHFLKLVLVLLSISVGYLIAIYVHDIEFETFSDYGQNWNRVQTYLSLESDFKVSIFHQNEGLNDEYYSVESEKPGKLWLFSVDKVSDEITPFFPCDTEIQQIQAGQVRYISPSVCEQFGSFAKKVNTDRLIFAIVTLSSHDEDKIRSLLQLRAELPQGAVFKGLDFSDSKGVGVAHLVHKGE